MNLEAQPNPSAAVWLARLCTLVPSDVEEGRRKWNALLPGLFYEPGTSLISSGLIFLPPVEDHLTDDPNNSLPRCLEKSMKYID